MHVFCRKRALRSIPGYDFGMFPQILLAQQRDWLSLLAAPYVERTTADQDLPLADSRVTVVLGPRRAGKSVYAAHLAQQAAGGCGYVNFDDERLLGREGYLPDSPGPRGCGRQVFSPARIMAGCSNP